MAGKNRNLELPDLASKRFKSIDHNLEQQEVSHLDVLESVSRKSKGDPLLVVTERDLPDDIEEQIKSGFFELK
jgi:hypothetical protein